MNFLDLGQATLDTASDSGDAVIMFLFFLAACTICFVAYLFFRSKGGSLKQESPPPAIDKAELDKQFEILHERINKRDRDTKLEFEKQTAEHNQLEGKVDNSEVKLDSIVTQIAVIETKLEYITEALNKLLNKE